MKTKFLGGVLLGLLSSALVSQAAYITNFNTAVPTDGGSNFATADPLDQDGWTINDSNPGLSFLLNKTGGGKLLALGGYFNPTSVETVNLTRAIYEPAGTSIVKIDYGLVNSKSPLTEATDPPFYAYDDSFGFTFSDASGPLLTIGIGPVSPTPVETKRQIYISELGGSPTALNPDGIKPSDYSLIGLFNLRITFGVSGSDLTYSGKADDRNGLAGGLINFSGTLPGKANAVITELGINYKSTNPEGLDFNGSNFMVVDSIMIPEPSAALTGVMALGLFGLRRRR